MNPEIHLLDINQAANYLDISVSCLYTWVSQKKVPYIKIGRCVRFDSGDLQGWLKDCTVTPDKAWLR